MTTVKKFWAQVWREGRPQQIPVVIEIICKKDLSVRRKLSCIWSSLEWTKAPDLQVFRNSGDFNCWREELIYHRTQAVHTGGVNWFINAIALLQEKALFKHHNSCFGKQDRILFHSNDCKKQCITRVIKHYHSS